MKSLDLPMPPTPPMQEFIIGARARPLFEINPNSNPTLTNFDASLMPAMAEARADQPGANEQSSSKASAAYDTNSETGKPKPSIQMRQPATLAQYNEDAKRKLKGNSSATASQQCHCKSSSSKASAAFSADPSTQWSHENSGATFGSAAFGAKLASAKQNYDLAENILSDITLNAVDPERERTEKKRSIDNSPDVVKLTTMGNVSECEAKVHHLLKQLNITDEKTQQQLGVILKKLQKMQLLIEQKQDKIPPSAWKVINKYTLGIFFALNCGVQLATIFAGSCLVLTILSVIAYAVMGIFTILDLLV